MQQRIASSTCHHHFFPVFVHFSAVLTSLVSRATGIESYIHLAVAFFCINFVQYPCFESLWYVTCLLTYLIFSSSACSHTCLLNFQWQDLLSFDHFHCFCTFSYLCLFMSKLSVAIKTLLSFVLWPLPLLLHALILVSLHVSWLSVASQNHPHPCHSLTTSCMLSRLCFFIFKLQMVFLAGTSYNFSAVTRSMKDPKFCFWSASLHSGCYFTILFMPSWCLSYTTSFWQDIQRLYHPILPPHHLLHTKHLVGSKYNNKHVVLLDMCISKVSWVKLCLAVQVSKPCMWGFKDHNTNQPIFTGMLNCRSS